MDNQAKDLKLGKVGASLSQRRNEKNAKWAWECKKKRNQTLEKNGIYGLHAFKKFICLLNFFNLKVDIFFVTLNKLYILLELNFDLPSTHIYSHFTGLLV